MILSFELVVFFPLRLCFDRDGGKAGREFDWNMEVGKHFMLRFLCLVFSTSVNDCRMVSPRSPGICEEDGGNLELEGLFGFFRPGQLTPIQMQPFVQRIQEGVKTNSGGSNCPPLFCLQKCVIC